MENRNQLVIDLMILESALDDLMDNAFLLTEIAKHCVREESSDVAEIVTYEESLGFLDRYVEISRISISMRGRMAQVNEMLCSVKDLVRTGEVVDFPSYAPSYCEATNEFAFTIYESMSGLAADVPGAKLKPSKTEKEAETRWTQHLKKWAVAFLGFEIWLTEPRGIIHRISANYKNELWRVSKSLRSSPSGNRGEADDLEKPAVINRQLVTPWLDSADLIKLLKSNKRAYKSDQTLYRVKKEWNAESQPKTNNQAFRFKLSTLVENGINYPPEWGKSTTE